MATGAALVIIVGTITAMHSEQAFAQHGVDVKVPVETGHIEPEHHPNTIIVNNLAGPEIHHR
jgi:hypothetical protein